jgi:hypothetical protein
MFVSRMRVSMSSADEQPTVGAEAHLALLHHHQQQQQMQQQQQQGLGSPTRSTLPLSPAK